MIGARVVDARQSSRVLFVAVAVGTTSFVASLTVSPLIGEDITGSAALSGLPWSAGVLGTGLASVLISQLMARGGRGPGLVLGYCVGAVGAIVAVVATVLGAFWLFVAAVLLMGGGNATNHLSRYAAADLYPPERRASGLSMVVWGGTVGGVAGPALLSPSGRLSVSAGLPELAGPIVIAAAGFAVAAVAVLLLLASSRDALRAYEDGIEPSGATLVQMWRVPRAQTALITLAVSQTVMVMIMAMTPLHMRMSGHGLGSVGLVISAHVFGMYGLSPVSGRLADRFGRVPMILVGFAVLAVAGTTAAATPAHSGIVLALPLFLLGLGWSFAFVSGSALLSEGLSYTDRARLQGATDTVVWTAAAVAGLGSGVLVGAFSYAILCLVGALLVVAPTLIVSGRRRLLALRA